MSAIREPDRNEGDAGYRTGALTSVQRAQDPELATSRKDAAYERRLSQPLPLDASGVLTGSKKFFHSGEASIPGYQIVRQILGQLLSVAV